MGNSGADCTVCHQYTDSLLSYICCYVISWTKVCKGYRVHTVAPLSYGASPTIWDHTVLPATRHK